MRYSSALEITCKNRISQVTCKTNNCIRIRIQPCNPTRQPGECQASLLKPLPTRALFLFQHEASSSSNTRPLPLPTRALFLFHHKPSSSSNTTPLPLSGDNFTFKTQRCA